jgi:predicted nucleic acid-binding protein
VSLLLDTGIVYAYYDASDDWHERALSVFESDEGPLLLPAPVIPEVDHLLGRRLGRRARQALYDGILDGAYMVLELPPTSYARVAEIDRRFADLELGFVDSAVVALAELHQLPWIASTDRRHFEPLAREFDFSLLP